MANAKPWTEGRRKAFITAVLRSGSRRWPPKYETLAEAKTEKKINESTGRLAQHYRCAACKKEFTQKNVQVDHINPVIDPAIGFETWDKFIERLYCDKENLQTLCTSCHKKKTLKEKKHGSKERSKNK